MPPRSVDAPDAANHLRRAQIERDSPASASLPFKEPVVYDVLDRPASARSSPASSRSIYSDQDIQNMSDGLSAFGLLPPNFPLKKTYINLLGEQIAAFYDQHQHKLFMFRTPAWRTPRTA